MRWASSVTRPYIILEEKPMKQQPSSPGRDNRFLAGLPASMQLDGLEHPCRAHNLSRNGVLLVGDLPKPEVLPTSLARFPGPAPPEWP